MEGVIRKYNDSNKNLNVLISDRYKVEVPSGNEFATNDLWLPRGKLPNGKLESIIKTEGMVKDIDYTIKDIYILKHYGRNKRNIYKKMGLYFVRN